MSFFGSKDKKHLKNAFIGLKRSYMKSFDSEKYECLLEKMITSQEYLEDIFNGPLPGDKANQYLLEEVTKEKDSENSCNQLVELLSKCVPKSLFIKEACYNPEMPRWTDPGKQSEDEVKERVKDAAHMAQMNLEAGLGSSCKKTAFECTKLYHILHTDKI